MEKIRLKNVIFFSRFLNRFQSKNIYKLKIIKKILFYKFFYKNQNKVIKENLKIVFSSLNFIQFNIKFKQVKNKNTLILKYKNSSLNILKFNKLSFLFIKKKLILYF